VDGDLSDPAWRKAAILAPFVRVATHDLPTQPTQCRVLRHAERLYLAFDCRETKMDSVSTFAQERDASGAWSDDCVEVFIAPGNPRHIYFHIIVTAANTVFDERCLDSGQDRRPSWNAHVVSAVKRREDRWTCEMSFPLADVAEGEAVEGAWAFAVMRAEQPHQEWSSWAPMNAGFHEYQSFGSLIWAEEPIVTDLDLPSPFVGRSEYRVSIGNAKGTCITELQIIRRQTIHPKVRVGMAANSSASYTYNIQNEGRGAVRLVVRREGADDLAYASPKVSFDVPAVRSLAQGMIARLSAAGAGAAKTKDAAIRGQLLAEIEALTDNAERIAEEAHRLGWAAEPPRARWAELHEQICALGPRARIAELRGQLAGMGLKKLPSFALGTESSLRKLAPDDSAYSISRELRLQCARRERESAQVIVASLGEAVKDVRVEWTGLRGPAGARLDHDAIEVHRVGYVNTRPPVYPVERVGLWPDPLMPLERFEVPAGEIQPLWITVSAPPDAKPGHYVGKLTVSAADEPPQAIALKVEVWDIELPLHGKFRTGFGNVFRGDVCQWYGFKADPPADFRRKFYDVLLKNRVNPAGLHVREVWPLLEDFDWCRERGLNALSLGSLRGASSKRLQDLYEVAEELRERDLLDIAYVYGFSGLRPQEIERARHSFSKVRQHIPGLRRACPMPPMRSLWGYVNIWATITSEYDHLDAQKRRHIGEEVWWYVCCGPRRPYANLFIDYPATDARALFWAAFKYRVDGFFYYEVAMWASNMLTQDIGDPSIVIHEDPKVLAAMREGRRWPDVPWNSFTFSRYNGDGLLIYPGPNETPLPSLRLEIIRDGIEDYELLAILRDLALRLRKLDETREFAFLVNEAMRLAAVEPEIVADLTHFTDDPEVIASQRRRVAGQIIRLQRALRQLQLKRPPS
jgi:hypothetical protein